MPNLVVTLKAQSGETLNIVMFFAASYVSLFDNNSALEAMGIPWAWPVVLLTVSPEICLIPFVLQVLLKLEALVIQVFASGM